MSDDATRETEAPAEGAAPVAEALGRLSVPALDEILGKPFKVLDDGFIRVIDYMGSDAAVVQAARVSYGVGTKKLRQDRGLIRYLLRHRHTTPFEMCELKVHVRVPMDAWRQWIRHRTANVNEYSTRYSVAIDAAQRTPATQWRLQSQGNRQGSEGFLPEAEGAALSQAEAELQDACRKAYDARLEAGVAREQARKDLPLCTYTEAYWKVDLHNLLHFLALRMDSHAQLEIREYARILGHEVVARWVPMTWEAFTDYRVGSTHLSQVEVKALGALLRGEPEAATQALVDAGWLGADGSAAKRHRERSELEAKLADMGVAAPWAPPA